MGKKPCGGESCTIGEGTSIAGAGKLLRSYLILATKRRLNFIISVRNMYE